MDSDMFHSSGCWVTSFFFISFQQFMWKTRQQYCCLLWKLESWLKLKLKLLFPVHKLFGSSILFNLNLANESPVACLFPLLNNQKHAASLLDSNAFSLRPKWIDIRKSGDMKKIRKWFYWNLLANTRVCNVRG